MTRIICNLLLTFSLFILSCKSPTSPPTNISQQGNNNTDPIGAHTDNWNSPLVTDLNNIIHKLDGASPSLSNDDLQPLAWLSHTKIVGLGEATHGTKEFFQMKHRIFKYLVENYGFKALAIEADMGESIYIDRYVTDGEGNLETLMKTKMHFWTWRTKEVEALLEWMRQYNTGKSESEKIHYIGVDCQYMTYQPDLILEYFNKVKPDFISTITPYLDMLKNMHNNNPAELYNYYSTITDGRKQEIADSLNEMLTKIEGIQNELISKSSEFEYNTIKQLTINLIQANDEIYYYGIRDKYMADNALWASNLFGEKQKIVLWAHNWHVSNSIYRMGNFLKTSLLEDYQIVGFSFSKGYFMAMTISNGVLHYNVEKQLLNTPPVGGSLNYIFYNAKYDNFILRTLDINGSSELGTFVSTFRPFILITSAYGGDPSYFYENIFLKNNFDVIINYDITSAAEQL